MTDPIDAYHPIHIALAFDENFWAPAYAVMRSICLNTKARASLVFHLCHDGVSAARRGQFEAIGTEFGAGLVFHDLKTNAQFNALCRDLPVPRRLHPVIYARLLLNLLLPPECGRVIYLDCDTMVMGPIETLWNADLEGKALAAVQDPWRSFNMNGRDLAEKRDIFDPAEPYFNSGMLVIDLARYGEADIPRHLKRFAESGVLARLYYDQDMLNLIFKDNWVALDWRFNLVDPRMAHQGLGAVVLHYTGKVRPWSLTAGIFQSVAFGRLYRHVMTNTVFYQFMRERWALRGRKLLARLTGRR